jgi:hypothetical protein
MGLILRFRSRPTPLHIADNGLAAFMDMDVFDSHFLLSLAPVAIQGFKDRGVGPGEFVCLVEIFAPAFERLFADHGAPTSLHRGVVAGNQLSGEHTL